MKHEKLESASGLKNYRYLMTTVGLTVSMYGINAMYKLLSTKNATYKLMACSMCFVLTIAILNYIYQEWGTKKYFQAGAIALLLNATSLYHWTWFGVVDLFSYLALGPAFLINWWVLNQLKDKVTAPWRLFLALAAAILLDNAILMNGLVARFGLAKAWQKLFTSIGLKLCYSAIAALSVYASHKFALSTRISRKFSYRKAHKRSLRLDRKNQAN